ncbi:hypothetical protein MKQ68_08665 [Chitinophaga horti]|uniref:YD repeat-containing protein n=1 Tax=Chitinophaga horti TaxID=2920382 RepID=A0ABY6J662_9BACT|nr:hypothetical protein [Chitinophaga horti]UYQ95168.1 hypothetical protein MKQ68_08665 [Chitinophaga horti]
MNKNILFGSLTLLFLAVIACEKVVCPEPDDKPSCKVQTLRFYYVDGTYYTETYTYNELGFISEVTDKNHNGGFMSRQEYMYAGNKVAKKKLYDFNNKQVAEFHFSYTGNKLDKEEYYEFSPDTALIIERTYQYKNNRVYRIDEKNLNVNTANYSIYTFTGANVTRIKTYKTADNTLTNDVELAYDNKKNPYYGAYPDDPGNFRANSPNNMIKLIEHVKQGNPVGTSFVTEYTYNVNGYPVDQSTIYGDKKIHELSYSYLCK